MLEMLEAVGFVACFIVGTCFIGAVIFAVCEVLRLDELTNKLGGRIYQLEQKSARKTK